MSRSLLGVAVANLAVVLLCSPLAEVTAQDDRRIRLGGAAGAPARHALVIGNSAYQVGRLANPVPDAQAMAAVLGELGFAVDFVPDATRKQMRQAVRRLREQLRGDDIGLFYFAGHGVQVAGENYLVPVGAEMSREEDVEDEAVRAQWVLSALQGRGQGTSLMILDACRNNPFARSFRSATSGLATMRARGGALIAYATGPGEVAADGAGDHSPYTEALLEQLRQPGVRILDVFTAVSRSVYAATERQQEPWTANSLRDNFVLRSVPAPVAAPPASPTEDPAALYAAAREIGTVAAYEAVIAAASDSPYASLAQAAIDKLQIASGPPPAPPSPRQPPGPICAGPGEDVACWLELTDQPGCYVFAVNLKQEESRTWTGACVEGLAHDSGTLTRVAPDGVNTTATGRIRHGKRQGPWVSRLANGNVWEGSYVDGKSQGQWVVRWPSGHTEEGLMVDDAMQGQWVLRWPNGEVHEGLYVDSQRQGQWIVPLKDGGTHEGPYVDGKRQGQWVQRSADGTVWEGPYVDGKRQGQWVVRLANGNAGGGRYVDGQRQGRWIYPLKEDEGTGEGRYVDGQRQGRWMFRWPDGEVHEGLYVDGQRQGQWELRMPRGTVWEGRYVDGQRHGKWVVTHKGGNTRILEYVNGDRQ